MDIELKRSNERARAKSNRQQFRNLIEHLNQCVSNEKLNTNRCLSMTTSILHLVKYFDESKYGTLLSLAATASQSDDTDIDIETIDTKSNNILPIACSPNDSFSLETFSIDLLMNLWNLTGIGFNKAGTILYTSRNLLDRLGLVEPIVGENIETLFENDSGRILHKVFNQRILSWVGYIVIQKKTGKETVSIIWNGKILPNKEGLY